MKIGANGSRQFIIFGPLDVAPVKKLGGHINKLANRSTPMVFIGYESGSKAYRTYDPVAKRVCVTHDIVFEEERPWDWSASHQKDEVFDVVYDHVEIAVLGNSDQQLVHDLPPEVEVDSENAATPVVSLTVDTMPSTPVTDSVADTNSESSWGALVRMRTLEDIYDATEQMC